MPSRRQVLAGLGSVAGLGLVGFGVGESVGVGDIETTTPPPDTWPQVRRDAANTASTTAELPSDPSVEWSVGAIADGRYASVVADADTAYVGGSTIAAHDRGSGANRWRVSAPGELLAVHDDTLLATSSRATDDGTGRWTLRAYDVQNGAERWRADLPSVAYGLTPTDDAVFVGCHGSLAAFGLEGGHRWTLGTLGLGVIRPAVHDGTLYSTLAGTVSRFEARSVVDVPLDGSPDAAWEAENVYGGYPAVLDDTLLVGNDRTIVDVGDPGVTAIDADVGDVTWRAIEGPSADREELVTALTPAEIGGEDAPNVGVTGVRRRGAYGNDDTETTNSVVGLDLESGEARWRAELSGQVSAVAGVAGAAVVATTEGPDGETGTVRAYSPDGDERWRIALGDSTSTVRPAVADVAPLDGQLLAVVGDGRLVSIR